MRTEQDIREKLSILGTEYKPEDSPFLDGWYNALSWALRELCVKCGRNLSNKIESDAVGVCMFCNPKRTHIKFERADGSSVMIEDMQHTKESRGSLEK